MAKLIIGEHTYNGLFGYSLAHCAAKGPTRTPRRIFIFKSADPKSTNERQAMFTLRHPLIISCDLKQSRHMSGLMVAYHANGDLQRFTRRRLGRALCQEELWFCFTQLLEALHYMHDQGVVHADLKPRGVRLSDQGRLQVADFGNALVNFPLGQSRRCMFDGSRSSHLPREAAPWRQITHALDFFSLASTICCLAQPDQRFPFHRNTAMTAEEAEAVYQQAPDIAPDLAADLRDLMLDMLEIEPEHRLGRATHVFRHVTFIARFGSDSEKLRRQFREATFPDFKDIVCINEVSN